jgi:flagellar hook assembly protein FlgD
MINNKNTANYLSQNFPNPFSSSTTIPYFLPFEGNVNLSVYNIMGEKIVTLVDETQQSGQHNKIWDGCDKVNCDLPGGVYLVCLKASSLDNKRPVLNSKMMLYIR